MSGLATLRPQEYLSTKVLYCVSHEEEAMLQGKSLARGWERPVELLLAEGPLVQLKVYVPDVVRRKLRLRAADSGATLSMLVTAAILDAVEGPGWRRGSRKGGRK